MVGFSTLISPFMFCLCSCYTPFLMPMGQSNRLPTSHQCCPIVVSPQIKQFPSPKIDDRGLVIHWPSGATCIPNHGIVCSFHHTTSNWALSNHLSHCTITLLNPITQTSGSCPLHTPIRVASFIKPCHTLSTTLIPKIRFMASQAPQQSGNATSLL